jgi:hypothetical protein
MLAITDLNVEFAKLKMSRGRTSQTTAAERENRSFARLMPYRRACLAAFPTDSLTCSGF